MTTIEYPQVNSAKNLNCPDSGAQLIDLNQVVVSSSKAATRKKRSNRIDVEGCPNWQISPDGKAYYKRREVHPDGNVPVIDLGPSAFPPVVPAYGGGRERFLDELVCWHFHRKLSFSQQRYAYTLHLDGDWTNCAAENVRQVLDAEYAWEQKMRGWMASGIPAKRLKGAPSEASFGGRRNESAPHDLRAPDITALPNWTQVVPTWVRDRIKAEQEKAA